MAAYPRAGFNAFRYILDEPDYFAKTDVFRGVYTDNLAQSVNYNYGENGNDQSNDCVTYRGYGLFNFFFLAAGKDKRDAADEYENNRKKTGDYNGVSDSFVYQFRKVYVLSVGN